MAESLLPDGYADLEPLADWALPTETARSQRRRDSTLEEIRRFYEAMLPRAPEALSLLNGFPLDALPPREQRLLDLCLALAEIGPFVEQYGRTVLPLVFDERRFVPLHDALPRHDASRGKRV